MKHRIVLIALSIGLAIPLLGFGLPAPAQVPVANPTTTLTLISGGGPGGYGTPDPITTYSIVGGSSGTARIVLPHPHWGIIPGARWVNTSGVAAPDQATTKTTNYTVSFALPKCYTSPSITVQVLADNAATLFVNSTQFGQQPQADFHPNYQVSSTFAWSGASAFHSGANTLKIANLDFAFPNSPDPNGIDFMAVITYSGFKFTWEIPPIVIGFHTVKAGSPVPFKFSLCGDQGLGIFAANYPRSEKVDCASSASLGDDRPVVYAGGQGLTFANGEYNFNWQTDQSWAGSCRKLTVRLSDGTDQVVFFHFA